MDQWKEHCDYHYATDSELDNHEAYCMGERNPNTAWVCTGRDVWHANPFYTGEPVPHPEEYN